MDPTFAARTVASGVLNRDGAKVAAPDRKNSRPSCELRHKVFGLSTATLLEPSVSTGSFAATKLEASLSEPRAWSMPNQSRNEGPVLDRLESDERSIRHDRQQPQRNKDHRKIAAASARGNGGSHFLRSCSSVGMPSQLCALWRAQAVVLPPTLAGTRAHDGV